LADVPVGEPDSTSPGHALGAATSDIHLGADASETIVKRPPRRRRRRLFRHPSPGRRRRQRCCRTFADTRAARALLDSHWAVDSEAATRLTTATFDRLKSSPGIGRAEALRQAMLDYLNDASSAKNAYPAFWGPFALIREGAGN
jgi:hypothetical protein